ncbi:MAG TPA: STAS domain-containing protein [Gemmatimonadaceae bacterium]|jgi:anti-anti-sigma factor
MIEAANGVQLKGGSETADCDEVADFALARQHGVVIVASPRTLVVSTRGGFREHVRQQLISKPTGIVVDCARAEYIDSSGLALLFSLAKQARRAGVGYCVARLADDLHTLLHVTRIDSVIQTADTLRAAILIASVTVAPGELDLEQLLQALEQRS